MLKALELSGFKSFADKTRFEFPSGITVVVGPNGSGKSNIVDAIKWVLGEQSARSLRGKEMADVIFKGSGNGNRRPANTAEATIIFDNREGILDLDASEVHITRRVYRSGEGEYLINGQACRLRDIKDTFRGTGVGTDAYSLIEQGKVDTLLQASVKDRRAIFEEAAGISRFKAKKVETQRRLERVEQNLLRLSDIVDEVDHRLRRLKSQATKARRYQEYTQRLQALRTHVGRVDWTRMTNELQSTESQLTTVQATLKEMSSSIDTLDASYRDVERQIQHTEDGLRRGEETLARHRETLTGLQTTVRLELSRSADFAEQIARFRRQLLAMSARTGGLTTHIKDLEDSLAQVAAEHELNVGHLERHENQLDKINQQLTEMRDQTESERLRYTQQMRLASELANRIAGHQSTVVASEETLSRSLAALSELEPTIEEARRKVQLLTDEQQQLEATFAEQAAQLNTLRAQMTQRQQHRAQVQQQLRATRDQRVAAGERRRVLEEFEKRLEGINAGVKEVLTEARNNPTGAFGGVRGIVADLLDVSDPTKGPMVAAALGERAQHVVVAGSQLIEYLQRGQYEIGGRVGFMRLESTPPASPVHDVDLRGQSGIIGRADDDVTAEAEYEHLVSWLLADTWFVESLDDAIQFRQSLPDPVRFVTGNGEVLERDGRVFVGAMDGALGVISRRAELRQVIQRIDGLEQQTTSLQQQIKAADDASRQSERQSVALSRKHDEIGQTLAKIRAQCEAARERREQLQQQQEQADAERHSVESALATTRQQLTVDLAERQQIDGVLAALEDKLDGARGKIQMLELAQQQQSSEVTAARVVVAKSEQRVDVLQAQLDQMQRDQAERDKAIVDTRAEVVELEERLHGSQRASLAATTELAELYLVEQTKTSERRADVVAREKLRAQRAKLSRDLDALRQQLREQEQLQHQYELQAEKVRFERTTLSERMREDYGLDISDVELAMSPADSSEFADADAEIAALRRKLSNIGSVNMDALSELEDLQQRYETLSAQLRDLTEAKQDLVRIIERINADSRRLFAETLEAIRGNFSVLFRKVFGGGKADIVLEEGVDMLEAGIDIIATPPGKNSLGLSLLSGGERALTAVTLLLAIFQYRPSPFCVLDEVDGPLDEANVGRFTDVLHEFLQWTKFIVVTHSKKTMTVAHTLYGVTMQESGVSKRVSVQFEDVSDDGHISQAALDRPDTIESSDGSAVDTDRGAA